MTVLTLSTSLSLLVLHEIKILECAVLYVFFCCCSEPSVKMSHGACYCHLIASKVMNIRKTVPKDAVLRLL